MNVKLMTRKAILLCRISDRKQEDGYSLEAQEKYGREYCQKNGFEIVAVYSFIETASKVDKRFKFRDMYKAILKLIQNQKGEPITLVVEKPDRLSRNLSDKELLDRHVFLGELEIHYYKERKILNQNSSPADIFSNDVLTSLNKYMASNTGQESKKGMLQKAENGIYPGKAPLGYINIREGEKGKQGRRTAYIVIDKNTSKAVNRIFELRAEKNYSLDAIRQTILDENLLPPKKISSINKGSIQKILFNPFYGGRFIFQGKEYLGRHELFVPLKWIEIVQSFTRYGGKRKPSGIFSGFFQCGNPDCGCAVIYDPKIKKNKATGEERRYDYYHCTDGKGVHKASNQKQVNVPEPIIWNQLSKPVSEISITEEFADIIAKTLNDSHQKTKNALIVSIERYQQEIKAKEADEDLTTNALLDRQIDQQLFERRIARIRAEKKELEDLYASANSVIDEESLITAKKILELSNQANRLWETRNSEEKVKFLKMILSNQSLDGVTLKYCLKKPFDVLSKMKGNEKWCPRRDVHGAL